MSPYRLVKECTRLHPDTPPTMKLRTLARQLEKANPDIDLSELIDLLKDECLQRGIPYAHDDVKDAADRAVHPDYYTRPKPGYGWR
ncbi:MAG: hypothetical protein NW237_03550 [Cyanobacteriota bacterium]|nr:hypothetical protein [Cyanobacteriota bacterium]